MRKQQIIKLMYTEILNEFINIASQYKLNLSENIKNYMYMYIFRLLYYMSSHFNIKYLLHLMLHLLV